jgi:hypothetical protein
MYGDLLDNAGEMWKNAAIQEEGSMETVSVMPVSLVSSLKGVSKQEKTQKVYALMMLKGTLDTAVGIDWEKTMDKDTTWKWRIIVRWLLWLSSWLGAARLPPTRGTLTTKQKK